MRELRTVHGGRALVSIDIRNDCNICNKANKKFNEKAPALPTHQFQNPYLLVFDLTSLQDGGESIYYPEISVESNQLEMFNDRPIKNVTEIIVLGDRMRTVKTDQFGTVAKNV